MRGRLADVAAGLGFLQGLANFAFAIIGWPAGQVEAVVAIALMILQGVVMLMFAVATYRRKLWGIYGLCAIAALGVGIALYERALGLWWIPPLIYLAAAVSMHRAASASKAVISRDGSLGSDVLSCPRCGEEYRLSDYRADAIQIFCRPCGAELPK